jgi:hypothetical protein
MQANISRAADLNWFKIICGILEEMEMLGGAVG